MIRPSSAFSLKLGAAFWLGLVVTPALAQTDETVVDGQLGKDLDRAVQRASAGGFWGTVLVAREGKPLLLKGYGNADYAQTPNGPRTLFEIASASKQFTAAAVLKLESQGKLALSDTIGKLLGDKVPEDKAKIRVEHLLHHTSGLSSEIGVPYNWAGTRDEYLPRIFEQSMEAEPGSTWAYNNAGYAILAAVVEVASGKKFDDYVREEIFAPAGLEETGFIRDPKLVESPRASLRLASDTKAADWNWGWGYRGMGGVVTNAIDLLKWDRALRGDKVLPEDAKKKLYAAGKGDYGCGWFVTTTRRGTVKVFHGGSVAGYGCQLSRYLDEDATVVILTNDQNDVAKIDDAIGKVLFPPPHVEATIDASGYELSEFRAFEVRRATFDVAAEKEKLLVSFRDDRTKKVFATVRYPREAAGLLANDFERAIAARKVDDPGRKAASDGGAYLGPYTLKEDKTLALEGDLELVVLPQYEGQDARGERVIDRRVTLVLQDGKHGQWPLLFKLNVAAAKGLLDKVKDAVKASEAPGK
jgi:CubicO group peptidase (beta-lactamase class C family)